MKQGVGNLSIRSRKSPNRRRRSRKRKDSGPEVVGRIAPGVIIDPASIQRAMGRLVDTLSDPKYQEQLRKVMMDSITNSLSTLQRLGQITMNVPKLDSKNLSSLINGSVPELMRVNLQFNSDLMLLMQKHSDRLLQILEDTSDRGTKKGRRVVKTKPRRS
jgi:hypothetical protein